MKELFSPHVCGDCSFICKALLNYRQFCYYSFSGVLEKARYFLSMRYSE